MTDLVGRSKNANGLTPGGSAISSSVSKMVTLYFCLDDFAPVQRYWSFVPRIGDIVSLPELGGEENTLKVHAVVCEGFEEPSVRLYLHHARIDHDGRFAAEDGSQLRGAI